MIGMNPACCASWAEVEVLLIHEMTHAASSDMTQDRKWRAEEERLRGLGVPVPETEFLSYLGNEGNLARIVPKVP
jgi:hypothetical protein